MGPDETEETAFLAEQRRSAPNGTPPVRSAPGPKEDESAVALPPLDDLVLRVPAPTRELIDQLFRARFITVKRIPATAFKTQNSP